MVARANTCSHSETMLFRKRKDLATHYTTVIWIGISSQSHKKAAKQNHEVREAFVWLTKRVE
jgi:hypothetical protein